MHRLLAICVLLATTTAVPTPITSPRIPVDTGAPSTSTGAPATITNAPTTGTSAPSISSNALLLPSTIPPAPTSEASTTASTPTTTSTIPPGYTYYAATRSYYKVHHERWETWDDANITCASEGAHLLVVNDVEEAKFVKRIMRDAVGDYYAVSWTGLLYNRGAKEWRTVHGEPLSDVFHEWQDGYPYNDAQWSCTYIEVDEKLLYGGSCDWLYYFTCELPR